jgi:cardiolipin synthase A/B
MWAEFKMPGDRGSTLDVLNRAASRGVDVRLIFWRPDSETEHLKRAAFWGSADQLAFLRASNSAYEFDGTEPRVDSVSTKRVGSSMLETKPQRPS